MPLQMTDEQHRIARSLFSPVVGSKDDRLFIRFNPRTGRISKGEGRRWPLQGAVLLHYVEKPAVTPTGGRYTARRMTIRTADGRKWVGTMKKGTDSVKLRPAP